MSASGPLVFVLLFFFCCCCFSILLNLFFLCLHVTISPQRPWHSLGFICNCEVQEDNISFIHQTTLSPVYTMRSYDDLHDTITDKSMKKSF